MTAYAIAHLRPTDDGPVHEDVLVYMERIQETLDPFGGRFVVHGTVPEVREGRWPGSVVMIAFPALAEARAWYESPAYQALAPLRTTHIPGSLILVEGVPPGYEAARTAARLRASQGARVS